MPDQQGDREKAIQKQIRDAERAFAEEQAKDPEAFAAAEQVAAEAFRKAEDEVGPKEAPGEEETRQATFVPEADTLVGRAASTSDDVKLQRLTEEVRDIRDLLECAVNIMEA